MRTDVGEPLGDPVADLADDLLRTAYLLTGSDGEAGELVVRGLDAARRGLRALPPGSPDRSGVARRGLVRSYLRRPWFASAVVDVRPTDASPAVAALAAALDTLPRRQRAAVVLRVDDDLPVERVAQLLGEPDAEPVLAQALAALPPDSRDPARLRRLLDDLADRRDAGTLGAERLRAGLRDARARRWQRALVGGVLVALVGAGGTSVIRGSLGSDEAAGSGPTSAVPARGSQASPAVLDAMFGSRPRGSLVGDDGFTRALLRAPADGVAAADRRVVLAGDLAGRRWGLVAGISGPSVVLDWFTGPVDAPGSDLTLLASDTRWPGGAAFAVGTGADGPVLLAVGRPGDAVEVSPAATVDAEGAAGRSYQRVPLADGVGTFAVPPGGVSSVRYRLLRDGVAVDSGAVAGERLGPGIGPALARPLRGDPGDLSRSAYQQALALVTEPTGLDPDELPVTVLAAGTVRADGGATGQVVTLAGRMPSGAIVTATALTRRVDGGAETIPCGSAGHPAGTDVAGLVVAVPCVLVGPQGTDSHPLLVVTAPAGVAEVTVPGSPTPLPLGNGWGYAVGPPASGTVLVGAQQSPVGWDTADYFAG